MTLAYAAFYFIPQIHNAPISLDDVWNVTLNRQLILDCKEQVIILKNCLKLLVFINLIVWLNAIKLVMVKVMLRKITSNN